MEFLNDKSVIAGVICSLTAAIVELFRRITKNSKKIEEKLETCEQEHRRRDSEYLALSNKLSRMEGEQEGIKNLANQVLLLIAEKNKNKNNKKQ